MELLGNGEACVSKQDLLLHDLLLIIKQWGKMTVTDYVCILSIGQFRYDCFLEMMSAVLVNRSRLILFKSSLYNKTFIIECHKMVF